MKFTFVQGFPLLVVAIAVLVGYILANPLFFGFCKNVYTFGHSTGCLDVSIKIVGKPLFMFSVIALIPAIVAIFLSRETFTFWLRFAVVWLILSVLVIALFPTEEHAWVDYGFIRENAAWVMGALFACISLLLVAWKSFKPSKA